MCIDRHKGREEYICVGCVAILEYVNQLEKYTRPELVEDDHQCDLCGARYIDTQEKVAKLIQFDSHLFSPRAGVAKSPIGNGSDSDHTSASTQSLPGSGIILNFGGEIHCRSFLGSSHDSSDHEDLKPSPDCKKRFACNVCHKVINRSYLATHMRVHTGERPYACTICKKSFIDQLNRVKHIRTHTGERPFSCTICNKAFTQQSHLAYHIRTHTGERPYSCTVCNKAFARHSTLLQHKKTHTGERAHSCITCNKAFAHQSSLEKHITTHTG